ncbi:hypothetical protein SAMN05192575_11116 [Nocardioides alpinus]|nr:ATP-binding protein [Nocardioides alpinus]SFB41765.1 hypothetical protein SAMN05192575_11116 [Nocardioides alpinus]
MCARSSTVGDPGPDEPPVFVFRDVDGQIEDPQRLKQLRDTGLLAAWNRPALDAVTHLAAQMTDSLASMVTLVEVDRQVFPSVEGLAGSLVEPDETPISHSLCQFVVMNDAPLVVSDARTHPVLAGHPAVESGDVVAYAGYPVHAPDGAVMGALCVIDEVARTWTPEHLSGLQDLARTVDTEIALRLSRRALHLDHERLMRVLDGTSHTLILIADVDGVIRTMNHAAEIALTPVADLLPPESLSDLTGSRRPWEPPGDVEDDAQEVTLLLPFGEQRTYSVRVSAVCDPEGVVDGYIVVGEDVSTPRLTQDLLQDASRQQVDLVERLKALDDQRSTFIATANHELRTPLTSILLSGEMLREDDAQELTKRQRDLVDVVVRNGRRLQRLVEDMLGFCQIQSEPGLPHAGVEVKQLTDQAWAGVQGHLAGRHLTTALDVPSDVPDVPGNPQQLDRVLTNLLINAINFTQDGGTVRLAVESDCEGVTFEVRDTGRGIPEKDQSAVFEPFFCTHDGRRDVTQGAGIGLAVARRIVESHGSRMRLTSSVGEGTTMSFTIAHAVA